MNDLFRLGLHRPIESSDIYHNLEAHDADRLATQFEEPWNHEKKKQRPRILRVIFKLYWMQIALLSVGFAAVDIVSR